MYARFCREKAELWDGYDSVLCHVTTRTDLLVDVYARFCREKAELWDGYDSVPCHVYAEFHR